jgi:glutamine---fructose-6-phosphate transaminase (isomerizing)
MHLVEDGEILEITRNGVRLANLAMDIRERDPIIVEWVVERAEKRGYPAYFLKENHQQPVALVFVMLGCVDERSILLLSSNSLDLRRVKRKVLQGCGSLYHAARGGKRTIDQWAYLPADGLFASEFRYSLPVIDEDTLAILITQLGEMADTFACLHLAKLIVSNRLPLQIR